MAAFIYTSGTGLPKGVMLSHHNLAWTAKAARHERPRPTATSPRLSYPPLSHIAEQMFTVHAPITTGGRVRRVYRGAREPEGKCSPRCSSRAAYL
ncbi:MAG: AMP-binding protein [Sandaracinaceae bacterium]|nr:AMP-binding protein [Sandaracinaceae bacterium]